MASSFDRYDTRLRRLPDWAIFAVGMALVAAVAAFRVTVAHDIPVADFLLIPVAGIGWLVRDRAFAYIAAACTAAVTVVIAVAGQAAAPLAAALAAAGVRFVLYLIVLALLGGIRQMQSAREKEARTDYLTGASTHAPSRRLPSPRSSAVAATARRCRCSTWTWTTSRRSTTPSVTARGTPCLRSSAM